MTTKVTTQTPFWKRAIVVLALGWVVIWISRMMLTPIYSVLSEFFGGVSNAQLGLISSFYFLGYVIMQIPSGILVDRFGMKAVVIPGFIVFAVGTVIIALSGTLEMLYAGSLISGAGCGTFFGIAYTITNVYVPGDKKSLAAYIVYFSTLYMYYLISTWLPNFLGTERGFADSLTGIVSSLVFFAGIPGALIFSRLADKMPAKKVPLIVGLELIASVFALVMIQSTNQAIVVASIVAYGFFGKLTVEPIIISWLGQFAPKGSVTTMFGVFNFFGMSASVVAPTVTGSLTDSLGSGVWGFYLAILIILVGTAAFLVIDRIRASRARA